MGYEPRAAATDLRTAARPQVLPTNVASVVVGFAMFAMSLAIPRVVRLPHRHRVRVGHSMLVAGLMMAPSGLVTIAAVRLCRPRDAFRVIMGVAAGSALVALAIVALIPRRRNPSAATAAQPAAMAGTRTD